MSFCKLAGVSEEKLNMRVITQTRGLLCIKVKMQSVGRSTDLESLRACVCVCVLTHAHAHAHVHACMHPLMHMHMHARTHTHTHTHTININFVECIG